MHVAIVLVGYRNPGDISHCVEQLSTATYSDFEIVICENGGAVAFQELEKILPKSLPGGQSVRIVLASGNLGYAGGVNLGIRETPSADCWWVLNPDTHPYSDALELQVARLSEGDCDAVGCVLHLPHDVIQSYGGHWARLLGRATSIGHGSPLNNPVVQADIEARQNYLNGASMLLSRKFVEIAGPMREDYFLYCEEVEWCLRALRDGARLGFAPRAWVLHYQGTTTGNGADMRTKSKTPVYLGERNRILLTRDLYPSLLPITAMAALGVILVRFIKRKAWRQLGHALEGWVAGLRGLRGPPSWIVD